MLAPTNFPLSLKNRCILLHFVTLKRKLPLGASQRGVDYILFSLAVKMKLILGVAIRIEVQYIRYNTLSERVALAVQRYTLFPK